jgi:hypothetical protein
MNARTTSARRSSAALTGALLTAGLLLTACGGDPEAEAAAALEAAVEDAAEEVGDTSGGGGLPEAPEECLEAFPLSVGGATLDDVELIPADWPAAPDGAVLCGTGGTLEGNQAYAEYAVPLDGAALLGHYQTAFPAGYTVEPTETISGPGLSGAAGEVYFTVEPREGGGLYISFGVDS